jgi:hypothetical protein
MTRCHISGTQGTRWFVIAVAGLDMAFMYTTMDQPQLALERAVRAAKC